MKMRTVVLSSLKRFRRTCLSIQKFNKPVWRLSEAWPFRNVMNMCVPGLRANGQSRRKAAILLVLSLMLSFCLQAGAADRTGKPISTTVRGFIVNAAAWGETNQVRLRGVVTLSTSDGTFFIQDGEAGVYVFHRPEKRFEAGELVEVTGNASLGGVVPTLQNCAATPLGRAPVPEAVLLNSAQAANPTNLMKLARMQGQLQKHRLGGGRSLVLQPENAEPVFEVDGEALTDLEPLDRIASGSLLEATGVVVSKLGPNGKIASIRLLIRSPEDVVILKGPPFWTSRRVGEAAAAAVVALGLAAAWIGILRREVRRQTVMISQRLEKEAALRASEDRFLKVFRTTPDILLIVRDADEKIVDVNPAFERMSGYSKDEAIGKTTGELGLYVHEQARTEIIAQFREGKPIANVQVQAQGKAGNPLWLLASMEWIEWNGARCWLSAAHNITEQKEAEEQQRQHESARHQSQKMEALGTMAGGIAHDFNNMLAVILGNAELVCEGPEIRSPETQLMLEEIRSAALRGKNLVQQIQAFSRKQEQHRKQTMRLDSTVEECARLLRAITPASIQIETKIQPDCPAVLVDPDAILQVVINLGTNGCHAMENRPGKLSIGLEAFKADEALAKQEPGFSPGDYVRLTVSDQGEGMEPQMLRRIFDPFFTTKAPGKGTGLGLAITHSIVTSHQGIVRVESARGVGSKFHVYLPAAKEARGGDERVALSTPIARGKGESILVVDDELEVLAATKRILEQIGYQVTALLNPLQAIDLIESKPEQFRTVVSDLNMPTMSGLDMIAQIRRTRRDLPVILLSGFITDEHRKQSAMDPALRFLDKPARIADLANTMRLSLQRPDGPAEN
jgi:PAS domain S-box-containing protein